MWYSRPGHRWKYKMACALCKLGNKDYKHALRICYFCTARTVTRTRVYVSLYVQFVLVNVKLVIQKAATGSSSVMEENCISWNRQENHLLHLTQRAFSLWPIRAAGWLEWLSVPVCNTPESRAPLDSNSKRAHEMAAQLAWCLRIRLAVVW
jgi:hypothetical protein